ncbi:MAG: hypothetical protein COA59_03175 [Colwellia sp.]|nr:MAG: hypothetical protein COA59_03175 [Colwellia sp.]
MDIFTTQLTRFIPVPIKPASLKVKALLKEAGAGKLKEDPDHLENHDYYFIKKPVDDVAGKKDKQDKESAEQQGESSDEKLVDSNADSGTKPKEEVKHLDLYV